MMVPKNGGVHSRCVFHPLVLNVENFPLGVIRSFLHLINIFPLFLLLALVSALRSPQAASLPGISNSITPLSHSSFTPGIYKRRPSRVAKAFTYSYH